MWLFPFIFLLSYGKYCPVKELEGGQHRNGTIPLEKWEWIVDTLLQVVDKKRKIEFFLNIFRIQKKTDLSPLFVPTEPENTIVGVGV